jgi:hypothetical protein
MYRTVQLTWIRCVTHTIASLIVTKYLSLPEEIIVYIKMYDSDSDNASDFGGDDRFGILFSILQ